LGQNANAQLNNMSGNNSQNLFEQNRPDSNKMDSLQEKWKDESAKIYYTILNSNIKHQPDTTLGQMHHFQQTQPWWGNDLGNYGTAARNLYFTPDQNIGFNLGYDIYDLYKIKFDSLRFYNTTRPYSSFSFMLGSKEEQNVDFLHTQNISPNWNFAARIRYMSSEGFFAQQKASSISTSITTDYKSTNSKYHLKLAFIYNTFNQDENGGIVSDSFLTLSNYADRRRIPVNMPLMGNNKSAVKNGLSNLDLYIQNNYSWGLSDTLYNEDSTKATYQFTPRFRLQHELRIHNENHLYKDQAPDSLRYVIFQPSHFGYNDSVYGAQNWYYVDNKFSINGFVGKSNHLAELKLGIANRIDHFQQNFLIGKDPHTYISNYLFGEILKEAVDSNQWSYQANAAFYFTGPAIGDFNINASIGRDLGKFGNISLGLQQTLSEAPFAVQNFRTNFYEQNASFSKVSTTKLWGNLSIPKIKLDIAVNNYIITNFLYFNEGMKAEQFNTAFYVTQISGRKELNYKAFGLGNEIVWQQATANAPLHLPAFMLREQLKIETFMFKNALKVAVGLEARYTTPYFIDAYTPYLNQFYLQNEYKSNNLPEVAAFFNFKIKAFRAFVVVDQLQQLIAKNNINALAWYPSQNMLFRLGFNWVLIN